MKTPPIPEENGLAVLFVRMEVAYRMRVESVAAMKEQKGRHITISRTVRPNRQLLISIEKETRKIDIPL